MTTPIPTGANGKFQPGNRAAVGRTSRTQKLRNTIVAAITRDDIKTIMRKLIEQARNGDQGATKILLGFIGKPVDSPAVAIAINQNPERKTSHAIEQATDFQTELYEHFRSRGLLVEDSDESGDDESDTGSTDPTESNDSAGRIDDGG